MSVTRTFQLGVLLAVCACYRIEDANPMLAGVELQEAEPNALVAPNTRVGLRVTGTELWNRAVRVEVRGVSANGAERLLDTLDLRFDRADELQTTSATWNVAGEVLRVGGRTRVFFRAVYETQQIDSMSFFVEVDPRLESVELIGGDQIAPGSTISARVVGRDVWSREIEIELFRRSEQGVLERLASQSVLFGASGTPQLATASFVITGAFLERAGRNELFFRVSLADQSLASDPAVLVVETAITAIRLLHELKGRTTPLAARQLVPGAGQLVLEADGTGMVGLNARISLLRQGTVIETSSSVPSTNQLQASFSLDDLEFDGAEAVDVLIRISVGSALADSPVVRIERAGFAQCRWHGADESPLENRVVIDSGDEVVLRADAFGLDTFSGAFEIWESDGAAGSDFVARLNTDVEMDLAEARWNAVYIDDGTLQTEAEYFFIVQAESYTCQSEILVVRN